MLLCRTKSHQGWVECVWAHRNQICHSHPECIPHHFPLRYTSWWVLWPPRTRQKLKLCCWPTTPPLEKKILHREMLFCNCLNRNKTNLYDDLFWHTVLSCIPVRPRFLLSRAHGEVGGNLWEHPIFKWYRNRCIFPALEMCSLPASHRLLNELFKKHTYSLL